MTACASIDLVTGGGQDLIYGFNPQKVAERLTRGNYRKKALVRKKGGGLLHICVHRAWDRNGKDREYRIYFVIVRDLPCEDKDLFKQDTEYARRFRRLNEAIRYANCEDGGALARETVPCPAAEIPAGWGSTCIGFVPGPPW